MYRLSTKFSWEKGKKFAKSLGMAFILTGFTNNVFADDAAATTTTTTPSTSSTPNTNTSSDMLGLGTVSNFVSQGVKSGQNVMDQTKAAQQQTTNPSAPQGQDLSSSDIQALSTFLQQNPAVAQQMANQMNNPQNASAPSSDSATPATAQVANNTVPTTATSQNITNTAAMPPVTNTVALDSTPPQTAADVPQSPWQPANDQEALNNAMAYRTVTQNAFPLSPEQIQQLRAMLDATQRAAAAAPNNAPPTPTSTSLNINLSPGATPPVIRLAKGFVSSLVFIDSTGAPWPIESYDIGDPQTFNIQWNKKNNTLMIQAQKDYNYGNLAVKLDKLNTPIMLTLIPGQQVVDYRVDLRVSGVGPNALPSIEGTGLPDQASPKLLDVLNGMSPKGAVRLTVDDNLGEAWSLDNEMYLRTRFTVLSPAWIAKMSSADGMNAYEMQKAPMVLVMRHGKVIPIKIEGLT